MNKKRILQVVKTTDGAWWALEQVKRLCSHKNLEVHVALPYDKGKFINEWKNTGVTLHFYDLDFPAKSPWEIGKKVKLAKKLIEKVKPDLIHSHFFGPTIILRKANINSIPMVFQVPGPLHLESPVFKKWELASSNQNDYWIASSNYIRELYLKNNISSKRVFLSYYGSDYSNFQIKDKANFRKSLGFTAQDYVVGNVSYIYAPKKFLFQRTGLKNHELIIDSIGMAHKKNEFIKGLLFGGQWGKKQNYENKLRSYSQKYYGNSLALPGKIKPQEAYQAWQNLDLAIHLPKSENCGGVIEPLLCGLPVLTNSTGGIPEVIFHKKTGYVCQNNVNSVIEGIEYLYKNKDESKYYTENGIKLVSHMFNVNRTADEIFQIYMHILSNSSLPEVFNSKSYLEEKI